MLEYKKDYKAWLYLAPVLILMSIFTFYPLFNTILIAFLKDYNYLTNYYDGYTFENFVTIFNNTKFMRVLWNTVIIVFVSVPISTGLSLLIAVCLNSIKCFQKVFQTIFFMPYVTNAIAIGMVFAVMFNVDYGLINSLMELCGITGINWIGPGAGWGTSMFVLLVYIIWSALPFKILILLSGLQNIDKQYYQAAQIDHASKKTTFWRITVPMLSPMIAYVLITSFIGAFKEYSTVIAIFGESAGPAGNDGIMGTVVWYIYDMLESPSRVSRASAAACILLIIILIFTAINLYVSKKKVHY